jgi:uncharacterized DUF497 family protein
MTMTVLFSEPKNQRKEVGRSAASSFFYPALPPVEPHDFMLIFQLENAPKPPPNIESRAHGVRRPLTVADLEHSESQDRWFSIGCASNGAMLSIAYLSDESGLQTTAIRVISARKATRRETLG